LDRTARCVRDTVDECDLLPGQIRAVGLAVPGDLDPTSGHVAAAPVLGWKDLPLKQELEQRLQLPVFPANDCQLAALAICRQELDSAPERFVAVFPDRPCFAAMLTRGQLAATPWPSPMAGLGLANGTDSVLRDLSPKQLRKAMQAGDPQAAQTVQAIAAQTGALIVQCLRACRPDVIVVGGGAAEELEKWLMPEIQRQLSEAAEQQPGASPRLLVSALGKDSGLIGAALWAAQRVAGA
jgi:glucokinase